MEYNTICQFCGVNIGHKINCPVFKMIDINNTFVPSITEKLVEKDLIELDKNAVSIKDLTPLKPLKR